MIYVRLEIWPGGRRDEARCLGEGLIANVGGSADVGTYATMFSKRGGFRGDLPRMAVTNGWKSGRVAGFRRKRGLAWDLLALALVQAIGDERLKGLLKE